MSNSSGHLEPMAKLYLQLPASRQRRVARKVGEYINGGYTGIAEYRDSVIVQEHKEAHINNEIR